MNCFAMTHINSVDYNTRRIVARTLTCEPWLARLCLVHGHCNYESRVSRLRQFAKCNFLPRFYYTEWLFENDFFFLIQLDTFTMRFRILLQQFAILLQLFCASANVVFVSRFVASVRICGERVFEIGRTKRELLASWSIMAKD